MRVLLIKTSSLGDVVHIFPALTDAMQAYPTLKIDWVVEEAFVPIAALHPAVKNIIPVALRRWRKNLLQFSTLQEMKRFVKDLRAQHYDLIIDAQGLWKSALIGRIARGQQRWGFDSFTARESGAASLYTHKVNIDKKVDALNKLRQLLSCSLSYPLPKTLPQSGLPNNKTDDRSGVLFLPGTTWVNKAWPLSYWRELAALLKPFDIRISIPWSHSKELAHAKKIQEIGEHITILEPMSLGELAKTLKGYQAVVSVDSGLGYLAAAYNIPTLMVYGPTTPDVLATFAPAQLNLSSSFQCAPCGKRYCAYKGVSSVFPACFTEITPVVVWEKLRPYLNDRL